MAPLARRLLGTAAATVDRAVVRAMNMRNASVRRPAESLGHDERLRRLAEIERAYDVDDATYFAPPDRVAVSLRRVREQDGGAVFDASWPSGYEPFGADVRDAYLAHARNATAHARLLLGDGRGRPAVILVHGYLAGQWSVEERAWPIRWLYRNGLDVAIALLPFHALRGSADGGVPPFPGADPRFTNEGFRQSVRDLRTLTRFLRDRGAADVGIMGMSLGGYTTALFATLEEGLGFAVPIIPLASIADFARDQGRLGSAEQSALQHAALEKANRIVSPLARPSRVPTERMLIVGADADRITPISHAERLAAHFAAPMLRMHGGHLLQFGRADAFRAIGSMLRRIGAMRPRG